MRLFEAILDANHRALAGDAGAGLHPGDFADELPRSATGKLYKRLLRDAYWKGHQTSIV